MLGIVIVGTINQLLKAAFKESASIAPKLYTAGSTFERILFVRINQWCKPKCKTIFEWKSIQMSTRIGVDVLGIS